jgi:hypothetical protein
MAFCGRGGQGRSLIIIINLQATYGKQPGVYLSLVYVA